MKNKTRRRAAWLVANKDAIESARTEIHVPARCKGYNARYIIGMSSGGWGWWARALAVAGIKANATNYWSGSAPTPSTAINAGIANYISEKAPADLM